MYNEAIKNQFIDEQPTAYIQKTYKSVFNRTSVFEEHVNKDAACLDTDGCKDLIVSLNPKSSGHVGSLISNLNKYASWAVRHKYTDKNYWSIMSADDSYATLSFTNRNVKDLTDLITIVESHLAVSYDKYVVYLLYMGIMGEGFSELLNIKDIDVDLIAGTITTKRRAYAGIIEPLIKAINDDVYHKERKQRDFDSAYFIKPYKTKHLLGQPATHQYVFRVFRKLNESCNASGEGAIKEFTPTAVWRSGMFNALHSIEQAKGSLVSDDLDYVFELFGGKMGRTACLADYEMYKRIFWS